MGGLRDRIRDSAADVDLQYAVQGRCRCRFFLGGFALRWILKKGTIPENFSSSRRLARVWGASIVAAALAFCVMPGIAQSAKTNPGANSAAASVQLRSQGQGLFRQHCASCHYSESRAQKIAVGLKGLYARSFSDGRKVTDAGLAKRIEEGGKDMPGFDETLKPEQVRALIAYIKTL